MLYVRRSLQSELLIILIDPEILDSKNTDAIFAIFSDGNAGSSSTSFFIGKDKLANVDFDLVYGSSWNSDNEELKRENKRKMCSEVLIYPSLPIKYVKKIVCPNQKIFDFAIGLKDKVGSTVSHISVEINSNYFF